MTAEQQLLLLRYLDVKSKMSELEEELERLKPAVFDLVDDLLRENSGKPVDYNGFTFHVQYRTAYRYSSAVSDLEQRLKELKKQEESKGIAQLKSQSGFVRVAPTKHYQP